MWFMSALKAEWRAATEQNICWRAKQAKKSELFVNFKRASDRNLNFMFNFNRLKVLFVYLCILDNSSSAFDSLNSAGTGGAGFCCNQHAASKRRFPFPALLTFALLCCDLQVSYSRHQMQCLIKKCHWRSDLGSKITCYQRFSASTRQQWVPQQ